MASFSSNVDIHFCLSGWVPDELVSLSLEQIICIFKCLVHQGAFSVTERQEKHAWGSSKSVRTGQMLRMCMEDGIHHHYLNSLSPSPNFHSSLCQLFVRKMHTGCIPLCTLAFSPLILEWSQPEQLTPQWFHYFLPARLFPPAQLSRKERVNDMATSKIC